MNRFFRILLSASILLASLAVASGAARSIVAAPLQINREYTQNTPQVIPDLGCIESVLAVGDGFNIDDLDVVLWIAHPWREDLDISLRSPSGTQVDLLTDVGGGADNLSVRLDDAATALPDSTNHPDSLPYFAVWKPEGALSAFNGQGTHGSWTLRVCDDHTPDGGVLKTWKLLLVDNSDILLNPVTADQTLCRGETASYTFSLTNQTTQARSFAIHASSAWHALDAPPDTPVLSPGASWAFEVKHYVPWSAEPGDSTALQVTVSSGSYSTSAFVTTTAALTSNHEERAASGLAVSDHALVYSGGKLYQIGGQSGGTALSDLRIFDIAANTWSSGTPLPEARHSIDCEAIGGYIYCAGGYNGSPKNTLYIYDIDGNQWSTGSPLPAPRYDYASVTLDGLYYVIGGYEDALWDDQATLWAYDPGEDEWDTSLASLGFSRAAAMAGVIGGKIYIAGGTGSLYHNTLEVYNPVGGEWTEAADLPTPWLNGADAVTQDRYLLILGGSADNSPLGTSTTLVYDAQQDAWFSDGWFNTTPVTAPRTNAEAAAGDGSIWLVSGIAASGPVSTTTRLDFCPLCQAVEGAAYSFAPEPGWTGQPVAFDASAAPSATPITYTWNFAGSASGIGPSVQHTFGITGTHPVTLTAMNCDGAFTDTVTNTLTIHSVEPTGIAFFQHPDEISAQLLQVCSGSTESFDWQISESYDWLGSSPDGGLIAARSCMTSTLTFNSAGLDLGVHPASLGVHAVSAPTSVFTVPITMTLRGFQADLSMSVRAQPNPATFGMPLTYTATITNAGYDLAVGLFLTNTLPAGMTILDASPDCSYSAGMVTCALANLAVGATTRVEIVTAPFATGTLTSTFAAASAVFDSSPPYAEIPVHVTPLVAYLPLCLR